MRANRFAANAVATALLIGAAATITTPARAQSVPDVPAPSVPSARDLAPQPVPPRRTNSIIALLLLDGTQIGRLNRAYDDFARTRLEQEASIAVRQDELRRAQAAATFDERTAGRLTREITSAEQKIADAFLRARAEALRTLAPEQRARLDALRADIQAGSRAVTDDRYRQLLLLDLNEIWQVPVDRETAQALLDERAFAARSPQPYRYYGSPYGFRSYGWGLGSGRFFNGYGSGIGLYLGGYHHHLHGASSGHGALAGSAIARPRRGSVPGLLRGGARSGGLRR